MPPAPHVVDLRTRPLTPDELAGVDALVRAATAHDGVAPLSEQGRLALRHDGGSRHLLAYTGEQLGGYAQLSEGDGDSEGDGGTDGGEGSAELVVDPAHRRSGLGSALLTALRTVSPGVRVWAHGDLEAAGAFAAERDQVVTRELFVLERPLGSEGEPLPPATLPDGLHARAFVPGQDEDEWLRVNAAAFVHHPEQGRLTRADLDERMQEPWFDPAGLVLVCPDDDERTVAASHWTKVHPAGDEGPDEVGEVYVVAVDPARQGRGLGRPVTLLGLHHLRERGLATVILYVDGDNPAALKVYRGLGFTTRSTDRMYASAAPLDGGTMTT